MRLKFTSEQEAFRQEILDFFNEVLPSDWEPMELGGMYHPDHREFTALMAKKLAEKGWLTMHWPVEYGGQSRSHVEQAIYSDEVSYMGVPGTDLGAGAVGWIGPTLIRYGTEEQKKEHLPPITRAERYWCTLYSEPEAGSDLASLQTSAVQDGDDFVVNGSKIWNSGAHIADWGWLAARTDPDAPKHRGISLMMVDMKTPGVTVRPVIKMTGDHEFNQVFFDNVRVPKSNLVGELDQGWYTMAVALDFERSGVYFPAVARRNLETLVQYAKETTHCGKRLSQNKVVRNKLVDSAIDVEVSRWLSYRVAWMQGEGMVPNYEASMAKVYGSELQIRLANTGMEILGQYGQLWKGSKWARLHGSFAHTYLNAFSFNIAGGTGEIQRNIMATRGLGLPRR